MKLLISLLVLFTSIIVKANAPSFDDISDEDMETIVREFSANFVHTSATPPTSLGKVFGVEAAMIVGATESPGVEAISKRVDPDSDVKQIPHAWLLGGVSVPYGVSVELNVLPALEVSDFKMSHTSVGLKWSITDQFLKNLPFDWAVRSYYTKSSFSFRQSVSNASYPSTSTVDVSFENIMVGGDTLIGFDFGIVEPYVGFGYVNTKGELRGESTTSSPYSLFDDQSSSSKISKQESTRLIGGCQFHLTMMSIGLEYTKVFSVQRLSAKVGLQF